MVALILNEYDFIRAILISFALLIFLDIIRFIKEKLVERRLNAQKQFINHLISLGFPKNRIVYELNQYKRIVNEKARRKY